MADASKVNVSFLDNSEERSNVGIYVLEPATDGLDYEAIAGGAVSNRAIIATALETVSKCTRTKVSTTIIHYHAVDVPPVDQTAQREWVMIVQAQDDVNLKRSTFQVPAPIDAIFEANNDHVDPDNVAWGVFKTAMEANMVSMDGNAVTLLGAYRSGKAT